jgi:hypothetical protein
MIFESTLIRLPKPPKKTLRAFRTKFIKVGRTKTAHPVLGGRIGTLLDNENDLVSLSVPEEQDRLTSFARDYLAFLFQTGPRDGKVVYVSDTRIGHFVAWLSVFIAAVLLIGAVVGLYVVQSPNARLAMIAAFTVAFAAGVGLLTNARRAELFAATAA